MYIITDEDIDILIELKPFFLRTFKEFNLYMTNFSPSRNTDYIGNIIENICDYHNSCDGNEYESLVMNNAEYLRQCKDMSQEEVIRKVISETIIVTSNFLHYKLYTRIADKLYDITNIVYAKYIELYYVHS